MSQVPKAHQRVPDSFEFKLVRHRLSAGFPSPAAGYTEDVLDLIPVQFRRHSRNMNPNPNPNLTV